MGVCSVSGGPFREKQEWSAGPSPVEMNLGIPRSSLVSHQRAMEVAEVIGCNIMAFDKYKETGGSAQKQTHVTFNNPEHPDIDVSDEEEEERMRQWYKAAKSVQSSDIDRRAIVGDFLVAVHEDRIEEFIQAQLE